MKIETVKIVYRDSYLVINKSDFDYFKHEIYTGKKPAKKPKKKAVRKVG